MRASISIFRIYCIEWSVSTSHAVAALLIQKERQQQLQWITDQLLFIPDLPKIISIWIITAFIVEKSQKSLSYHHPDRQNYHWVQTLGFKESLLKLCSEKIERGDSWVSDVKNRVLNCIDLVQVNGRYHKQFQSKFRLNTRDIASPASKNQAGCPQNVYFMEKFIKLCEWLDNEVELYSLTEQHEKIIELGSGKENVYTMHGSRKNFRNTIKIAYTSVRFGERVMWFV